MSATDTKAAAFTPGPWQVSPLDGRTCGPSRLLVQSGTTIAQMQAVAIVTLRTGETDANARLIAAAPMMYQELALAADTFRDFSNVLRAIGKDVMSAAADVAERHIRESLAAIAAGVEVQS